MKVLERQVSRAQRRLTAQTFVSTLVGWLFAFLLVALAAVLVNWYWNLGLHPGIAAGAAGGLAVVGALVWSIVFRASRMEAAIEIDRRFGLKERVSSTLALSRDERETSVGQALANDAVRRVQTVNVGERFGLSLSRWAFLPVVPGLAVLILALTLTPRQPNQDDPNKNKEIVKAHVINQKVADPLKKDLAKRKEEAAKAGLKELEKEFEKLTKDVDRNLSDKAMDRKDAVAKLNDLAKELEKRRNQVNAADELKKQLEDIKGLNDNAPGDKLAKALKDGNFQKALNELGKLAKELGDGKLNPEQMKQLAERLNQLKEKIEKMAQEHEKKKQELQQQIKQAQQQGNKALEKKLQQELDKLKQQDQTMKQMQQMANQMGQCSKCLQQGDAKSAMKGMQGMMGDLKDLERQMEELKMLDGAMMDIAQAKDDLMQQMEGMGEGDGDQRNQGDFARGKGRGEGFRDEVKDKGEKFTNSKVASKMQDKGAAAIVGEIDGPNAKGKARDIIRVDLQASESQQSDPLTGARLPKDYREHVGDYFDRLRDGDKVRPTEGAKAEKADGESPNE
jgi:hypothetical protein